MPLDRTTTTTNEDGGDEQETRAARKGADEIAAVSRARDQIFNWFHDVRRGFGGGAIMAALFLREFVGERRWAHLDVAGPARATSDDAEISKGATGFGTRLLLNWLTARN